MSVEEKDTHVLVTIEGSLSNEQLNKVKQEIQRAIDETEKHVILNLKAVTFICSSALSMLFLFMGEAKKKNRKFYICNVREDIIKLFVITGVDRHLSIYDSLEDAIYDLP